MAAVARRVFLGWLVAASAAVGLGASAEARPTSKPSKSGTYSDTYSDSYA